MNIIKQISSNLADLYLLFTREPFARNLVEELEYYSTIQGGLLGIIVRDKFDNNFSIIILSRDESKQYKAINLKIDIDTLEQAKIILKEDMLKDQLESHENAKFFDVFKDIKKPKQEHPHFTILNNEIKYSPAKEAIKEISYHYKDIDGNFIDQFQSKNGFDARLWELYLYCFFREQCFYFHRNHEAPDYIVEKEESKIAIEAVIVSRKNKEFGPKKLKTSEEMTKQLENEIPLMVSNAIYDKVKKRYWEKDHVKGMPFALAVADFHDNGSMVWTYEAFLTVLYGLRPKREFNADGKPSQVIEKVASFIKNNGTEIPAGLFFQKEYENISAIIYNPTATISKFNRVGTQAGLGNSNNQLIWTVAMHDHNPNALIPKISHLLVCEGFSEPWSAGATIFHNPNAINPIDPYIFEDQVAHYFFKEEKLNTYIPNLHPYFGFVYYG